MNTRALHTWSTITSRYAQATNGNFVYGHVAHFRRQLLRWSTSNGYEYETSVEHSNE
jgi:hypothetical protein